ncbi:hypothetical protein OG21DRAFT_1489771 [Imleria badia]|nr:hypothetical protein OG21DRAFT_1489771 [Imleria badia]
MAIEILGEYTVQDGTIQHHPKHDLESLIYVLVWICVLYDDPWVEVSSPCSATSMCLNTWISPKSLQQVRNLGVFKQGDLYEQVAFQEFTPYFKCLRDTIALLYNALSQSYDGGPALSHATIKEILLDRFFSMQEPELQNTQQLLSANKRKLGDEPIVQTTMTKQPRL